MTEQKAMYHWLVSAQVVFQNKDASDGGAVPINAVLLTEKPVVNAQALAQAQRTVTANLQERFQDPDMAVVDIVFLSFNNLGLMTREEFNPDGAVKPANG